MSQYYGGLEGRDELAIYLCGQISFLRTNYDLFGRIGYLFGRIAICSDDSRFVQTNKLSFCIKTDFLCLIE